MIVFHIISSWTEGRGGEGQRGGAEGRSRVSVAGKGGGVMSCLLDVAPRMHLTDQREFFPPHVRFISHLITFAHSHTYIRNIFSFLLFS